MEDYPESLEGTFSIVKQHVGVTTGNRRLTVTINRRRFPWTFTVVKVTQAIIGADFLRHFNLMVDVNNHRLVHIQNFTSFPLKSGTCTAVGNRIVAVIPHLDRYQRILAEFPSLSEPTFSTPTVKLPYFHI